MTRLALGGFAVSGLLGCPTRAGDELEPGEPGYVDCSVTTITADCDPIESCCEVLDDGSLQCWYAASDGRTWPCKGEECTQAAEDAACDPCGFGFEGSPPASTCD